MVLKLSTELRNKLKEMLVKGILNSNYAINCGMKIKVAGNIEITGKINFTNEDQDLIKEVVRWGKHIQTYFKTSCETYKVDIGRLEGVFPTAVESTCYGYEVEFSVDNVKPASWRDWFIQEGV